MGGSAAEVASPGDARMDEVSEAGETRVGPHAAVSGDWHRMEE